MFEEPLVRERDGRNNTFFRRSAPKGFGASNKLGRLGDDPMVVSSIGVPAGVGDAISICEEKYGCLWGRGEISILSFNGPGEEEGNGGVVTESISCQYLQYSLYVFLILL